MRIHIVEDELNNAEFLTDQLTVNFPDFEHTGISNSVSQSIEAIQHKKPAIVFLDVEIFGGTGFDVLKAFEKPDFKVIFCTGYDHYAVRAFKFSAIDYLLKPLSVIELKNAVEKAIALHSQDESIRSLYENREKKTADHIMVNFKNTLVKLMFTNIIRICADGPYSIFQLADNKSIVSSKTIGYYETLLPSQNFARVHHSCMVNKLFISDFDKKLAVLHLTTGEEQPVSLRRSKMVKEWIKDKA